MWQNTDGAALFSQSFALTAHLQTFRMNIGKPENRIMKNMIYTPLTATPFKHDKTYQEVLPADPELAGSIRCFWGSAGPYLKKESDDPVTIVIPDTCADIIYQIDYTANTVTGTFCGINDACFINYEHTPPGHLISVFAIRFYAWNVCLFSEDSLKQTMNGSYDVSSRFHWLDQILPQQLLEIHTLEERSRLTEQLLLQQPRLRRPHPVVEHAVAQILSHHGAIHAAELAKECFVSGRHLERLFHEYIGITPKKLCSLVRYQCLWNEIIRNPEFRILDAVWRYGYTDQPHLLREFRRYHTMDIRTARIHARSHVGNIQDFHGTSL